MHDGMTPAIQGIGTNHPLCSVGLSTVTTEVTFQISLEFTAAGKCFTEGNFLQKCVLIAFCQSVMHDSTHLSSQSKQSEFCFYCLIMDKNSDSKDTAQLLIFIGGVVKTLKILKNLLAYAV